MRASAATKVTGGTKGGGVNGSSSSKAADKRGRGAGVGKLPAVVEEEEEAEPTSEEAGRRQASLGTRPAKGAGSRRRESKRIALRGRSSRFQSEADEAYAASADLEKLLSRQNPSGWDFMVDPDKRPFFFDWEKGEHLKSKLKKWQSCIREVVTEALLRTTDGERFQRDCDEDTGRWAKEGLAHWSALNYLLNVLCITPYHKIPDDPFAGFNFQDLPTGEPTTEGELDRACRFSNPFEPERPPFYPGLMPRLRRDAANHRREIEAAFAASEDRGATRYEDDPEFPVGYKYLAPFIEITQGS